MFKLLKKLILVGAVAGVTVVAVKNTRVGGHVRHEAEQAMAWAESQVPVEKKIAKLRKDVSFLNKDISKTADSLAKEIVDCRLLTEKVGEERLALGKEKAALLARGKAIEDGLKVGATDKAPPAADAKDRLKTDVTRFKTREQQVAGLEKALETRERIKTTLEGQLRTLQTQKAALEAAIGTAEAKYKELQLAQMESRFQTDDTRLARIKEDLRNLNRLLDIEAEKLKLEPTVHEEGKPAGDSQSVSDILSPLGDK